MSTTPRAVERHGALHAMERQAHGGALGATRGEKIRWPTKAGARAMSSAEFQARLTAVCELALRRVACGSGAV